MHLDAWFEATCFHLQMRGGQKRELWYGSLCVCVEGLVITHTRFITCGSLQLNGPEMVCQTIETIYDVQWQTQSSLQSLVPNSDEVEASGPALLMIFWCCVGTIHRLSQSPISSSRAQNLFSCASFYEWKGLHALLHNLSLWVKICPAPK